jgi:DNA replication protein DnaC
MNSEKTLEYFKTINSSLWDSNIPKAHDQSHLYNFKNPYTKVEDKFWVTLRETTETLLSMDIKKCPRYIFLCGRAGSGKSHYEVGLYRAMLDKLKLADGGGVSFEAFSVAIHRILETFSGAPLYEWDMRTPEFYKKQNWLFLDDFTASEKVTDRNSYDYKFFREILLDRWNSERTLITSTNIEGEILLKSLTKLFDDYVVSRLSDSVIIQFPDQDLRQEGFGGHRKDDN